MTDGFEVEYWPSDLVRYPDRMRGQQVFLQIQLIEQWVHRRAERVTFLDDQTIRRQISVDFELPNGLPASDSEDSVDYFVPLALLRKIPLIGFDLRDEAGASVPVLTSHQNGQVAWSVLIAYAEAITIDPAERESLPDSLLNELKSISTGTPDEAERCAERLRASNGEILRPLMDDEVFANLISDFANNFLLLAVLPADSPKRRVLKFSYAEAQRWEEISLPMRLGWRPTPFPFDCPAVDEGNSYHFEAEAPKGLEISHSEMWKLDGSQTPVQELASSGRVGARSHLYPRSVMPGDSARVWVWLQPVAPGLVRAAFFFAVITTPLLAVILLRLDELRGDPTTGLLLALPGLVALAITRPGENLMTTRLLVTLRGLVGAVGFLPFAGALALVLRFEGSGLLLFWWLLVAVSFGLLVVAGRSYLVLTRDGQAPSVRSEGRMGEES